MSAEVPSSQFKIDGVSATSVKIWDHGVDVTFPSALSVFGKTLVYAQDAGQQGLADLKGTTIGDFQVSTLFTRQLLESETSQIAAFQNKMAAKGLLRDSLIDALAQSFADDFAFSKALGLSTSGLGYLDTRLERYLIQTKLYKSWHLTRQESGELVAFELSKTIEDAWKQVYVAVGYAAAGAHWVVLFYTPLKQTSLQFVTMEGVPLENVVYDDIVVGRVTKEAGIGASMGYSGSSMQLTFQSLSYTVQLADDAWKKPTVVPVRLNVIASLALYNGTQRLDASKYAISVKVGQQEVCTGTPCTIQKYDPSGYATYSVVDKTGLFAPKEGQIPLMFEKHFEPVVMERSQAGRLVLAIQKMAEDDISITQISPTISWLQETMSATQTTYAFYEPTPSVLQKGRTVDVQLTIKRTVDGARKTFIVADTLTITGFADTAFEYSCNQIVQTQSGFQCKPECSGILEAGVCYETCSQHPSKKISVLTSTGLQCITPAECQSKLIRLIEQEKHCMVFSDGQDPVCIGETTLDAAFPELSICTSGCTKEAVLLDFGLTTCTNACAGGRYKMSNGGYAYCVSACASGEAELPLSYISATSKQCAVCQAGQALNRTSRLCVKEASCSLIRYPRFQSPICEATCESSTPISESQSVCLPNCALFFRYGAQCVRACPLDQRSQSGVCSDSCALTYNGICVAACPALYFVFNKKCLLQCPQGTVYSRAKETCVTSCSALNYNGLFTTQTTGLDVQSVQRKTCEQVGDQICSFVMNNLCMSQCPYYQLSSAKTKCVIECPSSEPMLQGVLCYPTCMNAAVVEDGSRCVSACSNLHYKYQKVCVTECPGFLTREKICVDDCDYGNFTLLQPMCETAGSQHCPRYQFCGIEEDCTSQFKCMTQCQEGYMELMDQRECVVKCPVGLYYYNYNCQKACPINTYYYEDRSCEIGCVGYVTEILGKGYVGCTRECSGYTERDSKKCLSSCKYLNQTQRICEVYGSDFCPLYEWNTALETNVCKKSCLYREYAGECVSSCPALAPYVDGKKCVTKCPYSVFDKACVDTCPGSAVTYLGECYSQCPDGLQADKKRRCGEPTTKNKAGLIALGVISGLVAIVIIALIWTWCSTRKTEREAALVEASNPIAERVLVREPQMLI